MSTPRKRAGLNEMALLACDEASRIRHTQAALIKAGIREAPHPAEIRRAEVYEDMARLLFAIMERRAEVYELLAPIVRAMATAEKFERDREEVPPADEAENPADN